MARGEDRLPLTEVFAALLLQTETELDGEGERWLLRLSGAGTLPAARPRLPGC